LQFGGTPTVPVGHRLMMGIGFLQLGVVPIRPAGQFALQLGGAPTVKPDGHEHFSRPKLVADTGWQHSPVSMSSVPGGQDAASACPSINKQNATASKKRMSRSSSLRQH
jgi:hypothetical protein